MKIYGSARLAGELLDTDEQEVLSVRNVKTFTVWRKPTRRSLTTAGNPTVTAAGLRWVARFGYLGKTQSKEE